MTQTVIRIGNSAGIILPQDIRTDINIAIGDSLELTQKDGGVFLKKKTKKKKSTIDLKFAQMVDTFMTEHEDVLQELAGK